MSRGVRKRRVHQHGHQEKRLSLIHQSEGGLGGMQGGLPGSEGWEAIAAWLCLVSGCVWDTEPDLGAEGEPLMKKGVRTPDLGLHGESPGRKSPPCALDLPSWSLLGLNLTPPAGRREVTKLKSSVRRLAEGAALGPRGGESICLNQPLRNLTPEILGGPCQAGDQTPVTGDCPELATPLLFLF